MSLIGLIALVMGYLVLRLLRQRTAGVLYARIARLEGRLDELSAGTPGNAGRESALADEVERLEERVDFLEQLLSERPAPGRLPPAGE